MTLSNGDTYFGIFEEGLRQGYGILNFGIINKRRLDLIKIEGDYEQDLLEGNGIISYSNGDKLVCKFIHGVPNGPAKLFDRENRIKQVSLLLIVNRKYF